MTGQTHPPGQGSVPGEAGTSTTRHRVSTRPGNQVAANPSAVSDPICGMFTGDSWVAACHGPGGSTRLVAAGPWRASVWGASRSQGAQDAVAAAADE